jgi:hypothetical protein
MDFKTDERCKHEILEELVEPMFCVRELIGSIQVRAKCNEL